MPEKLGNYIERRAEEEGLNISEHKEGLDYVEGRKKLDFKHQYSSGESLEATENDGEAKFSMVKDGIEIFNFNELIPKGYKFVTPEYWLKLNEHAKLDGHDRANYDFPLGFINDPEGYRRKVQGQWSIDENIISIGELNYPKDIFALLHEIGHSRTLQKYTPEMQEAESKGDTKKILEIASEGERAAWAEAIKIARKIKKDSGVNLFEGFSDLEDIKRYIYTTLSVQRYRAEVDLTSIPKIVLDILRIDPKSKKSKFLDGLFDKRKLVKE